MDRRAFLANLAGLPALAAVAVDPRGLVGRSGGPLGVQLYTLRSVMDDPHATLEAVAGIGYAEVELAGLYGLEPRAFRRLLDGVGLTAPSSHVGLDRLRPDGLGALFDEADTLGHHWLVCPWTPNELRTAEGYRELADLFNDAGEAARARGLEIAYHNHDFEFVDVDGGTTGFGLLLERTDPALVSFQLDLFWAVAAGQDPRWWFSEHPGRWASVHAKDRAADGAMVAVGDGTLDFAALLAAAAAAGSEHVFVEHDDPRDPLDTVTRSFRHLDGLSRKTRFQAFSSPLPAHPPQEPRCHAEPRTNTT